jgi:hypothetical protein
MAMKLMKTGSIKQSLDWLQSSNYHMLAEVLSSCDLIKVINLMSDKCGQKEITKLEEDYEKELRMCG